jgi:glycosyltransferase involved in cell wall biosynthesis
VVIDDQSVPPMDRVVRKFGDLNIVYRRLEKNAGPASCRNLGIELATSEFVAFTDDDCQVAENWLTELYEALVMSDKMVAGVGGRVLARQNGIYGMYYEYHKILDPWYHKGQYVYLVTANSLFKKAALVAVGGFDVSMREPGGEDPGLCFKLLSSGHRFLYNPDAVVHHSFRTGLRAFLQTFYRYGFGCAVQSSKYFDGFPSSSGDVPFGGMHR